MTIRASDELALVYIRRKLSADSGLDVERMRLAFITVVDALSYDDLAAAQYAAADYARDVLLGAALG